MTCNDCIWYKYPLLTSNRLQTQPVPTVITDLRRCELGGCDGTRKEKRNERLDTNI